MLTLCIILIIITLLSVKVIDFLFHILEHSDSVAMESATTPPL